MTAGIFEKMSKEDILEVDFYAIKSLNRALTKDELEAIFKACDAFWYHSGKKNPTAPHAVLTSGKHSNVYVNCLKVLERSNLCQIMAQQVVYLMESYYDGPIDRVIGSDSSALGLSKNVADILGIKWNPMQKGPNKTQIWEKAVIESGEWVLHVEELLTTSLTTQAVRDGVKKGNPNQANFVPFIPLLVHRPDKGVPEEIDGSRLIWLLHYDTQVFDPEKEECELCKMGSPALPAKENWDELVATM